MFEFQKTLARKYLGGDLSAQVDQVGRLTCVPHASCLILKIEIFVLKVSSHVVRK